MKRKIKIPVLVCILHFAFCHFLFSQTVTSLAPTVIGSTGNFSSAGFGSISSSVGEPIVTTVSTGTLTLTQGFEQPLIALSISSITATPNDTICFGNSTSLSVGIITGTPIYTYNWSPSAGLSCTNCSNPVASPTITTTYTVVVTDGLSTTDSKSITIAVLHPTASISGQDSICKGNAVTLTDNVSGGLSPYAFSWNGGGFITQTIVDSPTTTTTYSVLTTDKFGCTATATHTVAVLSNPTVTITSNPGTTICSGSSTTLTASGANSYVWSPNTNLSSNIISNPVANPTTNITYSVTGNSFGCTNTNTVAITMTQPPTSSSAGGGQTICSTVSSVTLAANTPTSGTGAWTVFSGPNMSLAQFSNPSSPTSIFTPAGGPGNYVLTWTISNSPCTPSSSNVTITVKAPPTISNAGAPQTICSTGSASLTANNPASGTGAWTVFSGPSTSPIQFSNTTSPNSFFTPAGGAGTYILTWTISNSPCTPSSSNVTITVNAPPTVANAGVDQTLCNVTTATLAGNNPTSGSGAWTKISGAGSVTTPSQFNSGVTGLAIGASSTFRWTISNNPCPASFDDVVITVNPTPSVTIASNPASTSICSGNSVTLTANGGTTYSWWNNGSTSAAIISSPTTNTTYTVNGTTSGCVGTTTISITVNPTPTGITTASSISICNGQSATLTTTASGGAPPYTYTWSAPGGTTTSIVVSPTSTNSYATAISDIHGCIFTPTGVTVNVNPLPTASITATSATICSGNSTALTASGGGTYAWSTLQTIPTISVSPTANTGYNVTVTSAASCTNTASITIVVTPTPTISVTPPSSICAGGTFVLSASSNATNYLWSTGATASTISVTPSSTTNYTVTGGIGTCSVSATTTVTVGAPNGPVFTTTNPTCFGVCNGTATASVSGGYPVYTYAWNPVGGNAASAVGLCAGSYTLLVTDALGCTNSDTISIISPSALSLTVSTMSVTCKGGSNGTATANVSGGTLPYTYSWNPSAQTTPTATGLIAGNYNIQITDANGCVTSKGTTVVQPATAVSSTIVSTTSVTCNGGNTGSATVNATGGTGALTYLWSPSGGNAASATNLAATNYTITVTDNNGCTSTNTITIAEPPAIITSISSANVSCNGGNNGSATISASGGTSPYTYAWSNGGSTAAISNLIANTYSVVVKDANGCAQTASVSVTEPNALLLSPSTTTTSCSSSSDGTADANPSGGATPYTFIWDAATGNQMTQIATGLAAGNYSVVIKDANSCTNSATVTIAPGPVLSPTLTATSYTVCSGSPTNLTADGGVGATYFWNSNSSTATSISVSPAIQTTYSVSISLGTCTKDTFITIYVNPIPTASITAGGPTTFCIGGNVILDAGSGYSYVWSNSSTAQTISVSATGNYSVTITDINGCSASTVQNVLVNALPNITISGMNTICSGTNATLTANGGNTYVWSTSQSVNPILVSPPATTGYTVTGTDVNGCSNTDTLSVFVTPAPVATVTASATTICSGTTITISASGGSSYSWSNNQTSQVIIVSPTTNTIYSVAVSNGSCVDSTNISITVNSVTAQISGSTNVCIGNTITLSASGGGTYAWSGPNSFTSSSQNPSITNATPSDAGTYSVTVTVGICSDVATLSVSVTPPPVPTISIGTSASICLGQSTTLSAGPTTSTYAWSNGSTNQTIVVTPASAGTTTYSVTVSLNNCSADTAVDIFVFTLPAVSVSANKPIICPGDSVLLSATSASAIVFSWSPTVIGSGPFVTAFPPASTDYSVTVQDNNGCLNTASTSVSVSTITATATSDKSTICPGFTVHLDATASGNTTSLNYLWTGPVNDPTAQNPSATLDSTTTFLVEISNQDGCKDKDSITIFVSRDAACVIYIYNGITPNGDGDNDVWAIDGIQSFPDNKVQLFNRWGTKVWEGKGYNNKDIVWKGTNSKNENLPDGTYYYNVELYDTNGSVLYSASKWVEVTH